MIYDLNNALSKAQFEKRVEKLLERNALVELTDKTRRSNNQNSYLHLLIGAIALETGNTLEYVKEHYYKREANAHLYVTKKVDELTNKCIEVVRSSADLTTEEMTDSIARFKSWSAEYGYYLPEANDELILREIEIQMNNARRFL